MDTTWWEDVHLLLQLCLQGVTLLPRYFQQGAKGKQNNVFHSLGYFAEIHQEERVHQLRVILKDILLHMTTEMVAFCSFVDTNHVNLLSKKQNISERQHFPRF